MIKKPPPRYELGTGHKMNTRKPNLKKIKIEVVIIFVCAVLFYGFATKYDVLERMYIFASQHETWEMDEIISLSVFLMICLASFSFRRWKDVQRANGALAHQNTQLEKINMDLRHEVEAHQVSLNKLRSIYDASPVGVGILKDDIFQDVNEHFCQLTGYSKDDLIGRNIRSIHYSDENFDAAKKEIRELIISNGTALYETKHKRKNGQFVDVLLGFSPIDNTNPLDEVTFIALDMSERKQLEATLIESEAKYRKFFENDITGDFLMKPDGTLLDCNPAFTRMLGFESSDEIIGKNAAAVYPPEKTENNMNRLRKEKQIEGIQLMLTLPDKRPLYCIGNLVGHFDSEGNMTHVSGYYFDDTTRVLMEKELRKKHKMEAIGTLAGGIAHDFNNLLQPILGYAEFLADDLPDDGPQRKHVSNIINAGMRAKDLVQQILAFSRQSPHETIAVRVQNVLKEVVSLCRSTIPSSIEIYYDFQKECAAVMADPTQLHQVAMNLIVNAYHAIGQTAGKISVQVKETVVGEKSCTLTPLKAGRYALLSVTDTGCGMAQGTIDKIFEPYFTTKEQGKGTGLGLAVVYGIVKEFNGDINVYSEEGKGTTMNVYLPVMEDFAEDEASRRPEIFQGGQERVLLVDDEEIVLESVDDMLKRLGYQVTRFQNSTRALEAFTAAPEAFDLIITDMTMPELTGDQLAGKALKISPDMPIILCTGFSERIGGEWAKDIGVENFLMKPVSISELSRKIRQVLDV